MKKFAALILLTIFFALGPALAADSFATGSITVFIWSEYIDPSVVSDFEKQTGIRVKLDYYESNEEMVAKLQSGGQSQYDLIVPSTYFMASLRNLDLIQALDHRLLPNLKNLEPRFTNLAADPGNRYSVPYQWGTSGLVVRKGLGEQTEGFDTWGLFYNPQAELGSFIVFDTARDALGTALKYLGYSFNTTNPKEIEQAAELLIAAKNRPAFFGFDGGVGGLSKVMSGVAAVAQVYSGEAIRGHEEDSEVEYFLPREGCEVWTDLIAIPKNAPNPKGAHAFINFLLEPEAGARLATFNRYATPNAAAKAFIPPEDLANPAIYPDEEALKNMEYLEDLGEANRLYDEAWVLVKTR
jgi:spermidine/putrescine transport system substrate-binding protein